jgi:hypothetical protein
MAPVTRAQASWIAWAERSRSTHPDQWFFQLLSEYTERRRAELGARPRRIRAVISCLLLLTCGIMGLVVAILGLGWLPSFR